MMTTKGHDFDVTVVIIAKCKRPGCKCQMQIRADKLNRDTAAGAELWAQVKRSDADPKCPPCPVDTSMPTAEEEKARAAVGDDAALASADDAKRPTPAEVEAMYAAATAAEDKGERKQ